MLETGTRAPWTTSAGRLFDGLAALVGLHAVTSYEGQAAIAFEAIATGRTVAPYPLPLTAPAQGAAPLELDWRPLVLAVLEDLSRGRDRGDIAAAAHAALVAGVAAVAEEVGQARVALSGGCMQNHLLVEGVHATLRRRGHDVLTHRLVPPNDGGICLGQIAVAAARLA